MQFPKPKESQKQNGNWTRGSSHSSRLCSAWQGTPHVTCTWYLTGNCWLILKERSLSSNYCRRGVTEFPVFVTRRWLAPSESSLVHTVTQEPHSAHRRRADKAAWQPPFTHPAPAASWSTHPGTAPDPAVLHRGHTRVPMTLSTFLCVQWLQIAHFHLATCSCEMWSFLQSCPKTSRW